MFNMKIKDKKNLLNLARKTIEFALEGKKFEPDEKIKEKYSEKKACFVTLTKNNQLRGCIGSLIAKQELWKEVIENSINSAFNDVRFYPLKKTELKDIDIEISILSKPRQINYNNLGELKEKIKNKGVLISYSIYSATYLPQVWGQLKTEERFLSSLCEKAGLNIDFWKTGKLKVEVYNTENIILNTKNNL